MTRLRLRHLHLRAKQFADLSLSQSVTVYPVEIERNEKQNVLNVVVLAPHADDETLGAAGAIQFHIAGGDRVQVVLLSDRPTKDRGNSGGLNVRFDEFQKAMLALGVGNTSCLHLAEEEFRDNTTKNDDLTRLLIENQPDVLYLPSLFDNHQDHRIVNVWAGFALNQLPHESILCRGYEVWTPLPATAVLDITPFFETKQQAIRCYESQLENIHYDHHIAGLNAYRAMTFGKRAKYAEAFYEASAQQYQKLINQYLVS